MFVCWCNVCIVFGILWIAVAFAVQRCKGCVVVRAALTDIDRFIAPPPPPPPNPQPPNYRDSIYPSAYYISINARGECQFEIMPCRAVPKVPCLLCRAYCAVPTVPCLLCRAYCAVPTVPCLLCRAYCAVREIEFRLHVL